MLKKISNIIKETDSRKIINIFLLCLSIVFAIIAIATENKAAIGTMFMMFGIYNFNNFIQWFKKNNKGAYIYLAPSAIFIVLGFIRILG